MPCHVVSCRALPCRVVSCRVVSRRVASSRIASRLTAFYRVKVNWTWGPVAEYKIDLLGIDSAGKQADYLLLTTTYYLLLTTTYYLLLTTTYYLPSNR